MSLHGQCARWAICGGLLVAAVPARSLTFGRAVEPPPAIYASGPTRTGRTSELIVPSLDAVDRMCQLALGVLP